MLLRIKPIDIGTACCGHMSFNYAMYTPTGASGLCAALRIYCSTSDSIWTLFRHSSDTIRCALLQLTDLLYVQYNHNHCTVLLSTDYFY